MRFAAVGLFNAGGGQGMDEECLKYDPFFDWHTCTCTFEECLQLEYGDKKKEQKERSSAAPAQNAAVGIVIMLALLSTAWAVIYTYLNLDVIR